MRQSPQDRFPKLGLFFILMSSVFGLNIFAQETLEATIPPEEPELKISGKQFETQKSPQIYSENLITAGTYAFAVQNGVTLESMTSGATPIISNNQDDTASQVYNIGFDFWYDGFRFTQFSCNANGLCRLGATGIGTTFDNSANGLNTTVNAPKIAPFFEDLCTGTDGNVRTKVVGTAPNRKLVVEWFNMKVSRNGSCGASGNGTFQLWLFESGATGNNGVIQFVYGALPASAPTDFGASVGLQSGAATNFASVTLSSDTVDYVIANNTNIFAIPAGKSYLFTPNVPNAPSGLNFTGVTQTGMTLNWTDNAANEFGFAIYRSTDGVNYSFLTQTAADVVSFADSGLLPGTNYFYRVFAVSEGALSAVLAGNQTTNPAGNDMCAGGGGLWNAAGTWMDGTPPTLTDDVTIPSGCTVTINSSDANNITVQNGGVLQFEDTTARTLTVAQNLTINTGGTFQSNPLGTVTTHQLAIGGNLTNNGTLDFSTNGNTAGAELRFTGTTVPNATFTGTGTNDLRLLTVNKGVGLVSPTSPSVEINVSNMTVQGVSTAAPGFLNTATFNGIVKFSGTNTFDGVVFQIAGYSIPSTGGFWLNNPNFTVNGQNGSPTMNGLFRLSNGTFNVGTSSGNSMTPGTGSFVIIEGGTANFAGRLQSTSTNINYTQTGGTVNVQTIGNTATTAGFGLTATSNVFNLTGGTINIVLASGNATPLDYSVSTTSIFLANPAGTTLQFGNPTTYRVTGNTPNISIDPGETMNVGSGTGATIFFRGSTVTNNGAIGTQGTGSRFDWAASGPMSYNGSGTFGTLAAPFGGVGMSANSATGNNTAINSPIIINRTNFFNGGFTNSGNITYGNGGTSATLIQIGNTASPSNAGVFDVSPVHNTGSGGHTLLYLRTTTLNRPTGFEVPPSRSILALTHDDNSVGGTLVVTGGNLTVTGAMTLTNGIIVTNPSNILVHNGTATRTGTCPTTGCFVAGPLARDYTAIGGYIYHVGDNTGTPEYTPLTAAVSALGINPSTLSVAVTDDFFPNGMSPTQSVSRYWDLNETGDLTATIDMIYLDPIDVNGVETMYQVLRREAGITAAFPGGTVNPVLNSFNAPNVTNFSQWGAGNLAPLAATASIDGRVQTADGRGIRNAVVEVTGGNLTAPIRVNTGSFGFYRIEGLAVGETYVVTVRSKRFEFSNPSRLIALDENISGFDFVAEPLE